MAFRVYTLVWLLVSGLIENRKKGSPDLGYVAFVCVSSDPHNRLTSASLVGARPSGTRAEVVRHVAAAESRAVVVRALVQQVTVKPDNGARIRLDRYAILVLSVSCQLKLVLLRSFQFVVDGYLALVTSRDDIQTPVVLVRLVDRSPRAHCCLRIESGSEVKFVLVPRESKPDFRRFPYKEVVDPEYVGSQDTDDRVRQTWISDTIEELCYVAAGVVYFVHSVNAIPPLRAVPHQGGSVNVRFREWTRAIDNVFSYLAKRIVFFVRKDITTNEVAIRFPATLLFFCQGELRLHRPNLKSCDDKRIYVALRTVGRDVVFDARRLVYVYERDTRMPEQEEIPHRNLAAQCFNQAWEYIEKADRAAEETEEMINIAHASCYHWR